MFNGQFGGVKKGSLYSSEFPLVLCCHMLYDIVEKAVTLELEALGLHLAPVS